MKQLLPLFLFPLSLYSQDCSVPTTWTISPHYSHSAHSNGMGFETGRWIGEEEGRFSWFVGADVKYKKLQPEKTNFTSFDMTFYSKVMFTVIRNTGRYHLYAVAAPGIRNFEKPVLETGARAVLPFGNRMALALEPLYDMTKWNYYCRIIFAVD